MATVRTLIGNIKGPKGDTGATGEKGDTGNAARIRVGSTTTSAAGTAASVRNVGTDQDAVFDFTIPQGPPGSIGEIYNYPVNAITAQSEKFPVPAVGDTIAQVVGKQVKTTQDLQTILGDFGTVEPAATASKAYAVGDYLVLNGQFYKVTAAIAQGNALTVGGNIEATNVGAEVTSLKNDLAKDVTTGVNVNITSYSENNLYRCPTDGYVLMICNNRDSSIVMYAFNNSWIGVNVNGSINSVFVRKGTPVRFVINGDVQCFFRGVV